MKFDLLLNHKISSTIIVVTLLVCLFGMLMGIKLPNALLPAINKPEIQLLMAWPGKSAQEIEQSLITPLEQNLDRINNLVELQTNISNGNAQVILNFKPKTNMKQAYIDVLAAVNQVPGWPSEVQKPYIINNADGTNATLATAYLYSKVPVKHTEIIKAFKKIIEPELLNIPGVTSLIPNGNQPSQRIDIEFNNKKLAEYALSLNSIIAMLNNLHDASGDALPLGNREYSLHFKGKMTLEELAQLPIHHVGQHMVRLKDVAQIYQRLDSEWNFSSINGHRAFYFMIQPTQGVNALEAVEHVKLVIEKLNKEKLKSFNMQISLSRDDSKDIKNAIQQVYIALLLGIFLSGIILFYFLKNIKTVSLIFVSIPFCLSVVLIAMKLFHFSLNVISLAGLALCIGLLLDAAIVATESILAKFNQGQSLNNSISKGIKEVSAAIFSSTVSSIIIFIPILLIDSTESQLFEDLAFTISSALFASLLFALIVLPALARYILPKSIQQEKTSNIKFNNLLCSAAKSKKIAYSCVFLCIPVALLFCIFNMPDIDVLPDPKQRSITTFISFNEPLSPEATNKIIAKPIFDRIELQKNNPNAPAYDVTGMFCLTNFCLLYFYPPKGWHYDNFKNWLETNITQDIPGTQVFSRQGSLLRFALPNSRSTQLDIQGDELPALQAAGKEIMAQLKQTFPSADIRQSTPLENQAARIEFTPKYEQLVYYGMTTHDLNNQLSALTHGIYLGRFSAKGDSFPFYLKGESPVNTTQLLNTEIYIKGVGLRPLSDVVSAKLSLAPDSLLRINKSTTISLSLVPPQDMAVGLFSKEVKWQVSNILKQHNLMHLNISYRGSADQLNLFIQSFLQMFIFSVLILIFLLWLSLNSWKLSFAVILSMPLAFSGGMVFLQILNLFVNQALDVITMIGFIILLGLVINNAILLATKFQSGMLNNLSQQTAIFEAIESRKRPIYMSTATSIFGMLPLMLMPGEGSEIYRGLAAVIIGGMTFSALFSLSFMAALLSLPLFKLKPNTALNQRNEKIIAT